MSSWIIARLAASATRSSSGALSNIDMLSKIDPENRWSSCITVPIRLR